MSAYAASLNRRVHIASERFPNCGVTVRVSEARADDGTFILCIDSGAASLQTYATRDELRALGEMLLRVADEGEVLDVAT